MVRIWPKETPRHTESSAEKKVYDALKAGLPDGWRAWHSLRLRSRESGQFGEADFLIADPFAPTVLILEVKGGAIECVDGRWFQNGHAMDVSPLDQALSFRNLLIERFKDIRVHLPTAGCAVCFPDMIFEKGPPGDDLQGLVIGAQELPYLKDILPVVMSRAVPDPWPVSSGWMQAMHRLWGETWTPSISLGGRVELDAERRLRLDDDQVRILESLDENNRLLITGSAGTGKTVLAVRAAVLEAEKGKKVLLLCYTEALAAFLKAHLNHKGMSVDAVRQLASSLLGERGPEDHAGKPIAYWDGVSLRAAVDGVPPLEKRWDAVIVDEGQDFSGDDWELVKECVHPEDKLWVFADPAQGFWSDRGVQDDLMNGFMKFSLKTPYRCPPPIQHLDECYSGACQGVICLVSALAFHELTTQIPHYVWLAVGRKSRKPRIEYPPVRVFHFTGNAFTSGIESHRILHQTVQIYSAPKTIIDCFRWRKAVGLDVAIEAMREYLKLPDSSPSTLMQYAEICDMEKRVTPYLEALTA